MRGVTRVGLAIILMTACAHAASPVGAALADAFKGTQASALVVDWKTGAVRASVGVARRGAPGSVLKPLLLEYALEHGVVRAETKVYCRRDLHVGARILPCTHPADQPVFDAERALAESCNTWFAELAKRMTGVQLDEALGAAHLAHVPMRGASVEQRELAVLGLQGVTATLEELARAYRALLQALPADGIVARGLEDSVSFGMANPAAVRGLKILGKTGTASDLGEAWTHGWFAGAMPGRMVLVVYVPHGDGGTAARLAQKFFVSVAGR
jgi:peptidoglycan glycosyltransferase